MQSLLFEADHSRDTKVGREVGLRKVALRLKLSTEVPTGTRHVYLVAMRDLADDRAALEAAIDELVFQSSQSRH